MNGIYLHLLLREIKDELIGLHIDEIRLMQKMVQIVCGNRALFISLDPGSPAIFFSNRVRKNFEKISSFSSEVRSSRIKNVEQSDFVPVLKIELDRPGEAEEVREIIITLYREAPNFSVRTPFSQRNLFPRYIEKKAKKSITRITEKQLKAYATQGKTELKEHLIREIEGVDKYLAGELTPVNIQKLQAILAGKHVMPRLVSILPLRISVFASEYIKEYASFNNVFEDGVKQFLEAKAEDLAALQRKASIKNVRRRILKLKEKSLSEKEIEEYRIAGELILTNIAKIKKRDTHITLLNPYNQREVDIKLNPQITPQENAQVNFSKYKKLKRGRPRILSKIKEFEEEIKKIAEDSYKPPIASRAKRPARAEKIQPFRIFELSAGSIVYVGKNAKSNQDLTFRFAKPHDYFFHIRGYEGSHAILRAKVPKGQKPRKEDIEGAASIAAYFSKAKKQKNVAVSYTQRKYLKRNKKGKPGSVLLMREQVVFVDPKLPGDSKK